MVVEPVIAVTMVVSPMIVVPVGPARRAKAIRSRTSHVMAIPVVTVPDGTIPVVTMITPVSTIWSPAIGTQIDPIPRPLSRTIAIAGPPRPKVIQVDGTPVRVPVGTFAAARNPAIGQHARRQITIRTIQPVRNLHATWKFDAIRIPGASAGRTITTIGIPLPLPQRLQSPLQVRTPNWCPISLRDLTGRTPNRRTIPAHRIRHAC
ncbi:hypothetical protein Mal4_13280 [Maioricimonas rarisocia]|uniref:Uncharacterized protein n=2 Tax=Maioricimonas rarisocia TaxID=2528026 RepID=A0A517Z3M3_9PLAN|nr:hypothetical protein Mal4_13280 [Maioricimonas rarisocia]